MEPSSTGRRRTVSSPRLSNHGSPSRTRPSRSISRFARSPATADHTRSVSPLARSRRLIFDADSRIGASDLVIVDNTQDTHERTELQIVRMDTKQLYAILNSIKLYILHNSKTPNRGVVRRSLGPADTAVTGRRPR